MLSMKTSCHQTRTLGRSSALGHLLRSLAGVDVLGRDRAHVRVRGANFRRPRGFTMQRLTLAVAGASGAALAAPASPPNRPWSSYCGLPQDLELTLVLAVVGLVLVLVAYRPAEADFHSHLAAVVER